MSTSRAGLLLVAASFLACGAPSEAGKSATFTVGGSVTGLAGTGLVLQNKQGDDLVVTADGPFTFATPVANGGAYAITVKTQPTTPPQTCAITGGEGTVRDAAVTAIRVECVTDSFAIGGAVAGLEGSGLVLQNNGADDLPVAADGVFAFPTKVVSGGAFDVTVKSQPVSPSQDCRVLGGSGAVAAGDVSSVAIECATNRYSVGGRVSGLSGTGLVLRLGASELIVNSNGEFAFRSRIESGEPYKVEVVFQPLSPAQTCTVSKGEGLVGGADVKDVEVSCSTNAYAVGGNVAGLLGSGLVLKLDNGDELPVAADGPFVFATPVESGRSYRVTVKTQPSSPTQLCVVERGAAGTMLSKEISNVEVVCAEQGTYLVSGSVSGLSGTGLVLQLNGAGDLPIASNGSFRFTPRLRENDAYAVTVKTQPTGPAQACTVDRGSGAMRAANVTNVAVTCVSSRTIGGTVSGLVGTGLVLRNNGGDTLPVAANGPFTFATAIDVGATYAVTIHAQPTSPAQVCSIASGSGTVGLAVVDTVRVSCAPPAGGGGTAFTANGPGGAIPDGEPEECRMPISALTSEISVPASETFAVQTVSVSLDTLSHTYLGDLRVALTHVPTNRTVVLFDTIGGGLCGDTSDLSGNYGLVDTATQTLGDVASAAACDASCTVPSGNYRASGTTDVAVELSAPSPSGFRGVTAAGVWRLKVEDGAGEDTGTLGGWTLTLGR